MPQQCEAHFTTLHDVPSSPPPSPSPNAGVRPQDTFSVLDDDICIYAAHSDTSCQELSSSSTFGATTSTAPRQSSNTFGIVIHPHLPSPRFWVALVLSTVAVGWAGWRLALHDTENQVATGVLAFVFALWLPSPA